MHPFWSMASILGKTVGKMPPNHILDEIRWVGQTDIVSPCVPGPNCEALNVMPPPLQLLIGTNSSS
jgi:hypothetical protein